MTLLAPNGKPSNLTPEQYRLVRTPEFISWFGDWINSPETASKVIDENGEPLVVYHGATSGFNIFDRTKIPTFNYKLSRTPLTGGFFFTDDYTNAKSYVHKEDGRITTKIKSFLSGHIKSCFLNIRDMYIAEGNNRWNCVFNNEGECFSTDDISRSVYTLMDNDGVVFKNVIDSGNTNISNSESDIYVAFESNQIKLADGSNTTFDSNNPDIRFDNGGVLYYKTEPKYKSGQVLDLKGYGKVKILDSEWLEPPITNKPQYIYDFLLDPNAKITKYKRNDFSLYEYEVDMMLEETDMDVDYEASYAKYLSAGENKIGRPPLSFIKFIERINQSLYYGEHPELEPNQPSGIAKVSAFADAYAIHKYKKGGVLTMKKTKTKRLTRQEVKKKSEVISEKINKIKNSIRWHEGKKVNHPLTDIEKNVIGEYLPLLKSVSAKIYSMYIKMKDNGQNTIVDSATQIEIPNMKLFNLVSSSVQMKYILNFCEINHQNSVNGVFYSPSQLKSFEETIEAYKQEINDLYGNAVSVEEKTKPVVVPVKNNDESEIEKQAIAEVIELDKYKRLTQEEGEFLYSHFNDYENLVDEDGEYVSEVIFLHDEYGKHKGSEEKIASDKQHDLELSEMLEMLDKKQYVIELGSEIEAYSITIDFVNAVRGRIYSLKNIKQGADLFESESGLNKAELKEAIESLKAYLEINPDDKEAKDAIESMKVMDESFKDGGSVVESGVVYINGVSVDGKSFYFQANKDLTIDEIINLAKEKALPYELKSFIFKGVKYTIESDDKTILCDELYKEHHATWDKINDIQKKVYDGADREGIVEDVLSMWESDMKEHFIEEEQEFFPEVLNDENRGIILELILEHQELTSLVERIKIRYNSNDILDFCTITKIHIKKEEKLMSAVCLDKYKKGGEIDVPEHLLEEGAKVEMEHKDTIKRVKNNPHLRVKDVARLIANDHLQESLNYYKRLKQMEATMKEGGIVDSETFEYNDAKSISCCIISKATGKMLFLRRSGGDFQGTWCWLSGGVDEGEELQKTVDREIQEELGVDLDCSSSGIGFLGLTEHSDRTHYYYQVFVEDEFVPVLNDENSEYVWVSSNDEISNMHPLLKKYLTENKN